MHESVRGYASSSSNLMTVSQARYANRWRFAPTRCCGLPTARTATLLLAALGLISHIRLFSAMGALQDSFPSVPLAAARKPSLLPVAVAPLALTTTATPAHEDARRPPLQSSPFLSSSSSHNTAAASASTSEPETWAWHNLLPHYHAASTETSQKLRVSQTADGGRERRNWDSARLVTKTLRVYALLSAAASLAGIVGVLKPSLFATRIFVLSSFLDLFLFTLSLLALLILLTNAEIRSQLCEFLSAGSLSSVWDGGMTGKSEGAGEPSAWERLLEETFTDENCDDAFTRDVIPIVMLASLLYTAVRLYCFLVIHRWYMQLLRARIHHYFPSSSAPGITASDSPRSSSSPLLALPPRTSTSSSGRSSTYPSGDEASHANAACKQSRWPSASKYSRRGDEQPRSSIDEKLA
ncbi:hypothetical protein IE81DRAFT_207908 [Ceraceosorus guamensis]|uniref:Uncharacterized protein n=1 Tax=Ceraceosorus guamensis TaxID=1522189 RepID=A0A316W5R1_9BASI|nr:hypothetical protein IE81DRAFT_207908 [Ceraceosorus guamensis]PWN45199.1 hypothetical protein IE81DRAFT_207908 [Ceraceosorus guamensis]